MIFVTNAVHVDKFVKIRDEQTEFFNNSIYDARENVKVKSKMDCLNECFSLANQHSTVCAGITSRNEICHLMYPVTGDLPGFSTMYGVNVFGFGEIYLYQPVVW